MAFEELYRMYSGRLFSVACRMLGNTADAEDLLQEIFLTAHRKLASFRGESSLGTWLYRLATNQCLDHLRSRAARAGHVTDTLDDDPTLADASSGGLAERTLLCTTISHTAPGSGVTLVLPCWARHTDPWCVTTSSSWYAAPPSQAPRQIIVPGT